MEFVLAIDLVVQPIGEHRADQLRPAVQRPKEERPILARPRRITPPQSGLFLDRQLLLRPTFQPHNVFSRFGLEDFNGVRRIPSGLGFSRRLSGCLAQRQPRNTNDER
jgi:hypothetical protein